MESLQQCALEAFPIYGDIILDSSVLSDSVWNSELKTGKSLEIVALLKVLSLLGDSFGSLGIDDFYLRNPELFYLRNEIPLHHGAQAGHAATLQSPLSLEDRFIASIKPKGHFVCGELSWMVFREGNPLHLLESLVLEKGAYKERNDIVIVRGAIQNVEIKDRVLSFTHWDGSEYAKYQLSVKNSSLIPLKDFEVSKNYSVVTSGIIECSVSKKRSHVERQLAKYQKLFTSGKVAPECLFIHGRNDECSFETLFIELERMVSSFNEKHNHLKFKKYLDACTRL